MFMHDPQHTGMSKTWDDAPATMEQVWSAEVQTASTARSNGWSNHPHQMEGWIFEHPYIDSSPVVAGNKVVVGTWTRGTSYSNATGSVKAFNGETGALLWTATGNPTMGGVASTPCIVDNRVYVGSTNGYLYCFDMDGNQLWAQPTEDRSTPPQPSKILASAVVHDGIVYIGNEASKIYAFNADTGEPQVGYPITLPIYYDTYLPAQNMTGTSSPAIARVNDVDYLLIGTDDGYLYRLRLTDRQVLGVNLGASVESSPTVVGGDVYVGVTRFAGGSHFYRISIEHFQLSFNYYSGVGLGHECRSTAAHQIGNLYVGVDTGHVIWKLTSDGLDVLGGFDLNQYYETNYFVGSAALTTGGIVYVGNDNGKVYALSALDMTKDASYTTSGIVCSSPAIAYNVDTDHNRWVYVTTREANGRLLAFRTIR